MCVWVGGWLVGWYLLDVEGTGWLLLLLVYFTSASVKDESESVGSKCVCE
jgi:uncharacterized membrane protein